ncbi:MAG: AAA family ATPase, partial [Planctomycetota bacterium]|nr:AAA family ATPase [Planctomycetota bacterium]
EVSLGSEQKIIDSLVSDLKAGDTVRLDPSYNIALEKVGSRHKDFVLEKIPEVSWDMVRGVDYAIEALKEAIEYPYTYREVYKKYHKRIPKGVLLHGPPGCGKTLLAKSVAYNLSKTDKNNGNNGNGYFLNINGPEILNEYVGVSERAVRSIFSVARENSKENGYPTVIFIDEADAILQKRGSGISSDFNNTLVAQFLSELDGVESIDNYVVLLATNRPDMIDPAVLRPGRVDRKVKINRPDKKAAQNIFELYLADIPFCRKEISKLPKGKEIPYYAHMATARVYDFDKEKKCPCFYQDIISGAVIESIVQRASQEAIKREISAIGRLASDRNGKGYGLKIDDLYNAIESEYLEHNSVSNGQDGVYKDIMSAYNL